MDVEMSGNARRFTMSKYDPLWQYIAEHDVEQLSFDDVTQICGFAIDHAFLRYKKELDAYGFHIQKISMKDKTIKITKTGE